MPSQKRTSTGHATSGSWETVAFQLQLGRSAYLLALTSLVPLISMAATGPTTNEPAVDKRVHISVVDAERTGLVHSMVQLFKLPRG